MQARSKSTQSIIRFRSVQPRPGEKNDLPSPAPNLEICIPGHIAPIVTGGG